RIGTPLLTRQIGVSLESAITFWAFKKELKRKKKEQAGSNGSGKLKASLSTLSAIPEYIAAIESIEKQEILQQNTRTILKQDIRRIKFSRAKEIQSVDSGSSVIDSGKLTIKLRSGSLSFTHRQEDPRGRIVAYIKAYMS
ncbi:MAG: hypothetical protein P1P77_17515, partial [Spirochaetaceae bacterium]|nr:hypothetical protein [Spirochaetaceae bacterium]